MAKDRAQGVSIQVENPQEIIQGLQDKKAALQKAVDSAVKDWGKRAPAKVSKSISQFYQIKKADIQSTYKGYKVNGQTSLHGFKVDNLELKYSGRLLTPTHFGMTPKVRPEGGRKYQVRATIKKGQKKVLGSSVFLAKSGGAGTVQIPFQREGTAAYPIKAVKTVSVPQMITGDAAEEVSRQVNELLDERLQHHIERANKK